MIIPNTWENKKTLQPLGLPAANPAYDPCPVCSFAARNRNLTVPSETVFGPEDHGKKYPHGKTMGNHGKIMEHHFETIGKW